MCTYAELERFDVLKIQSVDTVSQSFHARCLLQLRVKGAKDRRESFVTFKDGATESVEWFAGRIEVLNSFEHDSCKLIDEKPTAVFSGLAFTLFAAQPSEPMERLSVAFTLLLTMAAYKITVAGMIPQVSYETLLDQFLLYNFFLLVAMAIASAVLPQVGQEAEDFADRVCLALLGAI
ncbi:hypothetical protein EMIHUDRAFT_101680 [Emiliania huxleyi CCMP1516]|uniref:Neurotransmitter-gated ion-channel transmembrane domain-containing protein n=2 Tax=Emiliania huxleyi TaxID=2903 RepID=A0A0D3JBU4_EMIH1|nr:hypothetical protein EMIHUDRAFT_101680 [Emiliania huxleyi CCMP1516]EOD20979.1 hypothetical protein EMIHUDRAFT_101680 [Emiliania huxleyi CCMP1516]|eukprot:XP_005773408.1 hypothetical protein EMIHUDRAFT_101680 [Emiliania huxleyi CCMP1516]